MGWIDRMLGKGATAARAGTAASTQGPQSTLGSPQSVRKELARLAVRESLLHNGIPVQWVRADPLTTAAPGREAGVHVRLVVQHWDARLMLHAVALQDLIEKRILALDPQADRWLIGLSWQFALEDASACPPLPHPGSWTAAAGETNVAPAATPAAEAPAAQFQAGPAPAPVHESPADREKRAELDRLFRARDAQFGAEEDGDGFGKTQPMPFEKTLPLKALDKTQLLDRTQAFEKTQVMERTRAYQKTQPMQLDKTPPPKRPDDKA